MTHLIPYIGSLGAIGCSWMEEWSCLRMKWERREILTPWWGCWHSHCHPYGQTGTPWTFGGKKKSKTTILLAHMLMNRFYRKYLSIPLYCLVFWISVHNILLDHTWLLMWVRFRSLTPVHPLLVSSNVCPYYTWLFRDISSTICCWCFIFR